MRIKLKPLREQVVVLTGGTSGNGLAIARAAARRGAALVLAARNAEALEEIAEELRGGGARVATCVADVYVDEDVERIASTAVEAFGGFDTWINDAAAATYGTMQKVTMADHRRIFDVNYFGLLKGSLVAARHLEKRGGAIINIGSVLSDRTSILQGPYSASKHAVKAATDALRMELAEAGAPVSVTLIKPSAIHTPYPEHARNYMDEPARLPQLLYDPRLVADAALFAAEHPRRDLYIGSFGYLLSMGGRLAPLVTDMLMVKFGRRMQTDREQPPPPGTTDNLYEPREDGKVDGDQVYFVRRSSLFLQAQMHRGLVAAIGAIGLTGLGLLARSRTARRRQGIPTA